MSEKEKMLNGQLYQAYDKELYDEREKCQNKLYIYNHLQPNKKQEKDQIIKDIINCIGELCIEQPFQCTYGYNITVGRNFYANSSLTILDQALVTIGNNVIIGPDVHIYTVTCPYNEQARAKGYEIAKEVIIRDHVYIGGHVTILPGVKINQGAIIGAGSVVTHDIPPYVIACGNPCKVIRSITPQDVHKSF